MATAQRSPIRTHDYGLFGPGSPSWKVWSAPTALIGFQRSVVLEHFDPFLAAAVADHRKIYSNPQGRLDRTLEYFLTVAVGDTPTVMRAAEILMRVHNKVTGIEPISGQPYSANDPQSQLWIHITGWHSVLKAYEMYGPGPLSSEDENRYWAECAIAAELQTCDPADVPRTRAGVRAYFAQMRPRLCSSEHAREGMHYLLRTPYSRAGFAFWAVSRMIAPATIASLPKWMRVVGGFDQNAIIDAITPPLTRIPMLLARWPAFKIAALRRSAPRTAYVMEQHHKASPPNKPHTSTPRDFQSGLHSEKQPAVGATPRLASTA